MSLPVAPSKPRAGTVNCTNRKGGECVASHYGGTPSAGTCEQCPNHVPVDPAKPKVVWITIDSLPVSGAKREPFDGSDIWAEWYQRANAFAGDATAERQWIATMLLRVPRFGCACRGHTLQMLEESPPDFTSAETYFASVAAYHNRVNARLKRPEWMLDKARSRWCRAIDPPSL